MKLAILGADAEAIDLARWAVKQGDHQLVAAYDSDAFAVELTEVSPAIRWQESWEALFVSGTADAVIIGRGGQEPAIAASLDPAERRADQLRKLVQASVPLIVVCPACEAIVGFEIEMIRRDVGSVIVPYVPGCFGSAVREVEGIVSQRENSPIGEIEQIALQREQTDRSREAVLRQLCRDVAIIRRLIGPIRSVSASGPPAAVGRDPMGPKIKELPSLANLTVHFTGEAGLTARWSISPTAGRDQSQLSIVGRGGQAVLKMPAGEEWTLETNAGGKTTESVFANDEAEQVFWQLSHSADPEPLYDDSAWLAACRDQEAAEAVDRSLIRGRTIELFNESHTEDQSFKGVMATGGCLLLLAAMVVVFFVVLVESLQLPALLLPVRLLFVWRLWPVYLLVAIVIFLLMQFLQLAVKREAK